ncbi:putative ATPase [Trypanosoma rangeli]|uniref:Putative ATPase n=1 Tax=Trypanosoma rangeli TaxID=5698 RepID=A0A3R7L848_TRYRA|nr:putative ATPase [Trypanosoma rangeli]RNF09589.1 putative ATPase [Trypanosoma rangeli]|eukprot:RNF09589.1 putative ATPase [Trypanosoma rangeli]
MYDALVQKGTLRHDPRQREMAQACTPLLKYIHSLEETGLDTSGPASPDHTAPGIMDVINEKLMRLRSWARRHAFPDRVTQDVGVHWPENMGVERKTGIYMWGSIGIGKTVILDLFELSETPGWRKRRTHLHSFMSDIVIRLHRAEVTAPKDQKVSPINCVVEDVLRESPILCLDEFQTFDVTHAALLASFFSRALPRGLILFTTSNRPPHELAHISAACEHFLPMLWRYCDVVHCGGINDYRENASRSYHDVIFLYPNTMGNAKQLIQRVERGFTGNRAWELDSSIWLYGRELVVPLHCGGVALFEFAHICGFLGPPDFQCIAKSFHTVIILNIPHVAAVSKNAAQQFVILVDELYQHNVKLLFTSEVPWERLVDAGTTAVGGSGADLCYSEGEDERSGYAAHYEFCNAEEVLSFHRIACRLKEMGCKHYLLRDHSQFLISDYNLAVLME